MKPFLGVDITENKKNETMDGMELVVATTSEELKKAIDGMGTEPTTNPFRGRRARGLHFLNGLCALGSLGLILFSWGKGTLPALWETEPWVFAFAAFSSVAWTAYTLIERKFTPKIEEIIASKAPILTEEQAAARIAQELSIPVGALSVNILSFCYTRPNGNATAASTSLAMSPLFLFKDEEFLYLADTENKFAFPLSGLKAIRPVDKARFFGEESSAETPYEVCFASVLSRKLEDVTVPLLYRLEAQTEKETYEIYFPDRDLSAFEAQTGLTAEEK